MRRPRILGTLLGIGLALAVAGPLPGQDDWRRPERGRRAGPPPGVGAGQEEPGPPQREGVPEERVGRMLERLGQEDPELRKLLEELRDKNPKAFQRVVRQVARDAMEHGRGMGRGPGREEGRREVLEIVKLSIRASLLAEEIRASQDSGARDKMTKELRALLDQLFEKRQQQTKERVKELEERLAELTRRLKDNEKNKGQIVEKRLKELLGEGTGEFDW